MNFDEWWKNETDDNENNVDDWKGFCKTAFEAGQKEIKQLGERCNQLLKDKGYLTDKIEKMKKYIKSCWVEENLNDYSSYITNTSDEFIDLVKELNEEIRNGR